MADYDFFDLTGLPFDPPEKGAKKIAVAVDKRQKELGALLGKETDQVKRDSINEQLKLLSDTAANILSPDGKKVVDKVYLQLAETRTREELKKLESIAKLMAITGNREITEAVIKEQRRERKLSDDHVREVFRLLGFTVKRFEGISVPTLFPVQAGRVSERLAALRRAKDPNPNGADNTLVVDLYSFAAYLSGEPEKALIYRGKSTEELAAIFDSFSRKLSQREDNLGKLCGEICASAKMNVFNSNENRKKYEFYLKYSSTELVGLFESMKGAPSQMLSDSSFAEPCIKQIAGVLECNYETALAVYNHEGAVEYSPVAPIYIAKCRFCGTVSQFRSEAEAISENACRNCKKPLFKKCTKCNRSVLSSLDSCPYPDCGFVFASTAMFGKLYASAEAALEKCDFELARKLLFEAQSANPSEKQRIEHLSARISASEEKYKKPISELKRLIYEKRFYEAQTVLSATLKTYPSLNVADIERTIKDAVGKADSAFSAARTLPVSERASACISILQYCADHRPSLDFLRATPPSPAKSFTVQASTVYGHISLAWTASGEQGVKYRLVRKAGNTPPIGPLDGTVLLEDSVSFSFSDKNALAGQPYTYALFVSRMEVCSEALARTAVLYSDVQGLRASQLGDCVRLTWDIPRGSMGATVTKTSSAGEVVLSRNANGSLEDRAVSFGMSYTYRVRANYKDSMTSPGVSTVVTPMVTVDSFNISATRVKDNLFKVTWNIKQKGVSLRVSANGALVGECSSDPGELQISLPKNTVCNLSVSAHSGGKWLESNNSIRINTYSSIAVDRERTEMTEEPVTTPKGTIYNAELKIRLSERLPDNVSALYYAVRTTSASEHWATLEEAEERRDVNKIEASLYKKSDGIIHRTTLADEQTLYVTVFTAYNIGGREVISEPTKAKIDRALSAELFWRVSGGFLATPKLTVSIVGNRPIERIPTLVLCSSVGGEFINDPDSPNAVELSLIDAIELDSPQKEYTQVFPLLGVKLKKGMRLFLFEKEPVRSEKYALRWFQGFQGKV